MDLNLQGRVVLVTGANRGIGRAIARSAADEGATVVVLARDEQASAETVEDLGAHRSSWIRCDVTRHDEAAAAMAEIERRYGRLDALVNNAGRFGGGPLMDVHPDGLREGFETKVVGAVVLAQAAAPMLRRSDQARIVNISGITAQRIMPGAVVTAIANSGMVALTGYMARELAPDRIAVNCVIPGYILTDPWRARVDALAAAEGLSVEVAMAETLKRQDMGHSRWGSAEEIADVVVFLLSGRAGFINGAAFRVDGGQFLAIQG